MSTALAAPHPLEISERLRQHLARQDAAVYWKRSRLVVRISASPRHYARPRYRYLHDLFLQTPGPPPASLTKPASSSNSAALPARYDRSQY